MAGNYNYICDMEVTNELIDKLSKLSRLTFNDAEKEVIREDLQKMIGFVEKLQELDLSAVEPMLFVGSEKNVLRDDEVNQDFTREQALINAPSHDGIYFKVPKVIQVPDEISGTK
jgi:aspartyl-tRNA(Asn)/glutamyl-tRNA(Gln) amidotransferase subunit C